MKKILSLILALIFIWCFGACQNNPPTPDDPSPDPHNTPQVQATYRMEEAEYSLPQKQFLAIPSHNDSRLLVIESDGSGYDPAHNNTFVYQLISQQETNLSGYAFDARLVGDTVYWLGLVPDESGKSSMHLLKTDLSGSSTETVYAPPAGYQFIEAMSSDSRYVVWAEYDGENGVSDDKPLVLKSHNCATGEITTQDDEKYHKYIGGMGMAYRIMYEEAPMELDPYDEKALVIFGVGPLTGAGVPCSGRMNVTFRSTWSKGHSIIDAHMGGHIGSMLKYAGYDGIVVSGISEKPVYLRIEDGEVSLEDASEIWGKGTFAANKWMVEQNGREFETASIGPAGENLVDYSTLNTSFGNSGGAGLGAAMGNKKLKGLAIRGTGSVKVADPKKVLELSNYMMGNLIGGNNNHNVPAQPQSWAEYSATSGKNRWSGAPGRMWKKAPGGPVDTGEQPYNDINKVALRCFKGYFDFGAPAAEYTVKNGGCSSCPIRCYTEYDVDPLADYDLPTHNSNTCMPVLYGTRVYPDGVHDFKYEGDGTMVINLAWSHAVDDMGLWDNYGNLNRDLLWILRMPREEATKYISEAEYDSLPWEWEKAGDPRWEVELIRRMAYGEGDLSVIAKGTLAMMEKFGLPKSWLDRDDGATNSNLIYNGFPNHHGPAEAWHVGMLYNLVYNRDCMIHEIVCETGSGAPYDVTKKVMEDFFGEGCYDKAKAYTPINENKAKLAAYCVNDKNFHDSATLCNWMWPMTQSPSKEREYHGDLDLQADFMTAVTGETYTQAGLQEDGARITQMLRAMTAISFQQNCGSANLRQEHDAICDWVFDKDPDFKAFEEGTTKLDRADMEKAKDLFYDIFGWDRTTGVPTRETLEKYDLADMADDLEKRGIYAQNTAAAE